MKSAGFSKSVLYSVFLYNQVIIANIWFPLGRDYTWFSLLLSYLRLINDHHCAFNWHFWPEIRHSLLVTSKQQQISPSVTLCLFNFIISSFKILCAWQFFKKMRTFTQFSAKLALLYRTRKFSKCNGSNFHQKVWSETYQITFFDTFFF